MTLYARTCGEREGSRKPEAVVAPRLGGARQEAPEAAPNVRQKGTVNDAAFNLGFNW